ncbi:hypothetical protein ABPG74_009252 [Tetrahymena malaccensis]
MDSSPQQNQNLSSQQIKQRLLDLFDLNESIENSRQQINQWNELFFIEQNISLRNQLINNILSQEQSPEMQENLQNERNQIQNETLYFKKTKLKIIKKTEKLFDAIINSLYQKKANIYYTICFYENIPISYQVDQNLTKIQNDLGEYEYKVQGYKEIFSIERTPINPQKKYKLELEIKNCSNQTTYIGYKSFHQNYPIFDRQIRIFQGTEVKLIALDMVNKAFIVDNFNNNLSRWNNPNTAYCEKYIGIYKSGCINDFIKAEDVICYQDTQTAAYREIDILNNKIYLTDWGWNYYLNNIHQQTILNQAVIMNHGGQGTYDYCEGIQTHYPTWTKKSYHLYTFRKFTDSVEVCILANYQGTQNKVFEFKNVNLIVCKEDYE